MCQFKRKKKLIDDSNFDESNLDENSNIDNFSNDDFSNKNFNNENYTINNNLDNIKENNIKYNISIENIKNNNIESIKIEESSKIKQEIKNFNPKTIWGQVISLLRQENSMVLFTACGEIRHVEKQENKLIVNIYEEYLYNILTKDENFYKLSLVLKKIDKDLTLSLNFLEKEESKSLINLKRLKRIFKDELEIRDN